MRNNCFNSTLFSYLHRLTNTRALQYWHLNRLLFVISNTKNIACMEKMKKKRQIKLHQSLLTSNVCPSTWNPWRTHLY